MIKRRAGGGTKELPLLDPNSPAGKATGNVRRRSRGNHRAILCSPCSMIVSCVALVFVLIYVSLDNLHGLVHHTSAGHAGASAVEHSRRNKKRSLLHPHELVKVARDKISKMANKRHHNPHHHVVHPHDIVKTTELDQFPTLQESFKKSKLVGLYFGANWCKECTMATEAIQKAFDNSPALSSSSLSEEEAGNPHPLSIVFVSSHHSDYTEEQYKNYGSTKWQRVPFNSDEQTKLKQHFHACAEREAEELHVDRKYKVPHFIILDSETRGVLTTLGVQDVLDKGYDALAHWQTLQKEIVPPLSTH